MKVLAARRRDVEDIRLLVTTLGLTSAEQALALCAEIFPDEPVPDRVRLILQECFDVALVSCSTQSYLPRVEAAGPVSTR